MRFYPAFALVLLLGVAAFPPRAHSGADRSAAQGAGIDRLTSRYRGVLRDSEVFLSLEEYRRPQVYVASEVLKLEPEDIDIVPKSAIANLDKIVRQYTRELLPVSSIAVLFRAFETAAVTVGAAP